LTRFDSTPGGGFFVQFAFRSRAGPTNTGWLERQRTN
jgi:hypothetical protein